MSLSDSQPNVALNVYFPSKRDTHCIDHEGMKSCIGKNAQRFILVLLNAVAAFTMERIDIYLDAASNNHK